jgi:hypothetical protein
MNCASGCVKHPGVELAEPNDRITNFDTLFTDKGHVIGREIPKSRSVEQPPINFRYRAPDEKTGGNNFERCQKFNASRITRRAVVIDRAARGYRHAKLSRVSTQKL